MATMGNIIVADGDNDAPVGGEVATIGRSGSGNSIGDNDAPVGREVAAMCAQYDRAQCHAVAIFRENKKEKRGRYLQ